VIEPSIDESLASSVALAGDSDGLLEDAQTDLCACGHPPERHDERAARYCRATVSNDLQRRCICVDPAQESAGRR